MVYILLAVIIFTMQPANADSSADSTNKIDTFSDTWVGCDALGRKLPTYNEVGLPRQDRYVGVFYFLWLGAHNKGGPYDITKILAQDPDAMQKKDSPLWGSMHAPHLWGESIFGYYKSDDEYVIRKHAQMLSDAGVDVIIFDVSNNATYKNNYMTLLRVFSDVRKQGGKTPQVAFLCPFGDPSKVVAELYKDLYEPALYPGLWFRWEGKPLIMADPAYCADLGNFFTFRKPQPSYFVGPTKPDMWSWLEVYPQHVFKNSKGEKEQMSVGVAQNAVDGRLACLSDPNSLGRSYHNGAKSNDPSAVLYGYNFAEQWERALKEDPKFIFVTGWNEWQAGRFDEFNGVKKPVMFVDEFDQEHSRDIEPMKGGHGDNYYYQLASYIRKFKGVRKPPISKKPRTILLDKGFTQWAKVEPEYRDDAGDTAQRNHPGFNNFTQYINTTGRNDIVLTKIAVDKSNIYFYVRTRDVLTDPIESKNWMLLLIDADMNHATGWNGYDYILNLVVENRNGLHGIIMANEGGTWNWKSVGRIKLVIQDNELQFAVPRELLNLAENNYNLSFDFKWADNISDSGNIVDMLDNGDVAPNGRFSYRFLADYR